MLWMMRRASWPIFKQRKLASNIVGAAENFWLISVWRSLQILEFDRSSWKRRNFRGVDDIEEVLNNFLNHQYPGQFLTRLTYYSSQNWTALDTKYLRSFVHSRSGRALHLAHFYLLKKNLIFEAIQEDYQRVITRMRSPEIKFSVAEIYYDYAPWPDRICRIRGLMYISFCITHMSSKQAMGNGIREDNCMVTICVPVSYSLASCPNARLPCAHAFCAKSLFSSFGFIYASSNSRRFSWIWSSFVEALSDIITEAYPSPDEMSCSK